MSDLSIHPAANGSIHSIRNVASLSHPSNGMIRRDEQADAASPRIAGDRVELSDTARLLNSMRQMPEIRQDRVDTIRNAIARGVYDTADRLDVALDKMLDEIADDQTLGL